jgi:hypothetical protein
MTDGFFVEITQRGGFSHRRSKPITWIAELVDKVNGWPPTKGESPEQAAESQKLQYLTHRTENAALPVLVKENDGPKASGKIVRFIDIREVLVE